MAKYKEVFVLMVNGEIEAIFANEEDAKGAFNQWRQVHGFYVSVSPHKLIQ